MRTFTPTEIDLCKKIAEKDFKEITYGDYYSHGDGAWHLCDGRKLKHALDTIDVTPLWQEHDCLEFLRKQPNLKMLKLMSDYQQLEWTVVLMYGNYTEKLHRGKRLLEALLRAVLAVMEA